MELAKKYLFWIVMAAVVVIVVVADVLVVGGMQAGIVRERQELRTTLDGAEKLHSDPGFIVAKASLEDYTRFKEDMKTKVENNIDFYRTLSFDLYKPLPGTEGHIGSNKLPSAAAFRTAYPVAMEELRQKLLSAGIQLAEGAWMLHDSGTTMPRDKDIFLAQVDYWLLRDIIDVLSDRALKVKRLEGVTVDTQLLADTGVAEAPPEELRIELALRQQTMFFSVPFTIDVNLDFRTVGLFLQALERVKNRRAARVRSFTIRRITGPLEEKIYSPLVSLRAECEILHYTGTGAEQETTTATVGG